MFWSFESCLPKLKAFGNLLFKGFLLSALLGGIPETAIMVFCTEERRGFSICGISEGHFNVLPNISL